MEAKSLFEWSDVFFEYVGFLASFGMLGAIGFRYGVLRGGVGDAGGRRDPSLTDWFDRSSSGAALVGVVGSALGVVSLVEGLMKRAEAKHLSLGGAFGAGGATSLAQAILLAVLLVAFLLAWRRAAIGWPVAGVAGLAFALRGLLGGRLGAMVNPLHVLGASLWIGTLFVLVVCGIGQAMRASVPPASRELAVAQIVHRFSALALGSAGLLGVTGLITGWTHLKPFSALWTTPYGYALLTKLSLVAVVLGLGAWNWRRVGPALGRDGGARTIRRTATTELAVAAVVLFVTAILVSLPSPKLH